MHGYLGGILGILLYLHVGLGSGSRPAVSFHPMREGMFAMVYGEWQQLPSEGMFAMVDDGEWQPLPSEGMFVCDG
jgi:hypothetical protein